MEEDFGSMLSRVESNDPTLVDLALNSWTRGIPSNRAEVAQRVAAALVHNTHVQQLKLYCLDLTEDDIAPLAELFKIRDVHSLVLHANALSGKIVLPALAVRNQLSVLDLSLHQKLTALDQLSGLTNLKKLYLRVCSLSEVPPAVLSLTNLEALKLSANTLKTLPPSFASLVALKELSLDRCGLTGFPTALLALTQLQELTLSDNPIVNIPDGITALKRLKCFLVENCGLTEFPHALLQFEHLEVLNLSSNRKIQRVPDDITNLHQLKALSLSSCQLTELPAALWTLTALEKLGLGSNPLLSLPAGIGTLSGLKELDLQGCGIDALPVEIQGLVPLDISRTSVTYLPLWLASLRSLSVLRCVLCSLEGVAASDTLFVSSDELVSRLSDTSSEAPEHLKKLRKSLKTMLDEAPLQFLRTAQMHFAPRTTLRELCMSQRGRFDIKKLPSHIKDEIARRQTLRVQAH
eukprot:TRINITY_DN7491_c0_g1_i1.p1 TRINITY_DN7491_c0_g1~~TRINITY_DN7491_c0_g1_i1.p1  ORF type:complete len:476 (-),score=105.14 TRINITY_DN7491_c0_g1_i1:112-1503(-)